MKIIFIYFLFQHRERAKSAGSALHVAGMMHEDFLPQMGGIDMGVDLGGGNGFMTQHSLYGT